MSKPTIHELEEILEGPARTVSLNPDGSLTTDGWRFDLENAPEDETVLLATTGGWVDTAEWIRSDDHKDQIWCWHGRKILHPNLKPLAWQPLPDHPLPDPPNT